MPAKGLNYIKYGVTNAETFGNTRSDGDEKSECRQCAELAAEVVEQYADSVAGWDLGDKKGGGKNVENLEKMQCDKCVNYEVFVSDRPEKSSVGK